MRDKPFAADQTGGASASARPTACLPSPRDVTRDLLTVRETQVEGNGVFIEREDEQLSTTAQHLQAWLGVSGSPDDSITMSAPAHGSGGALPQRRRGSAS